MVDDDSDILMAFLITGLVNADVHESVKPSGTLRLKGIQGTMDTSADSLPVDSYVIEYDISGKTGGQSSDREVKIFCEIAAGVSPWDIRNIHTMFRTLDAKNQVVKFNSVFDKYEQYATGHEASIPETERLSVVVLGGVDDTTGFRGDAYEPYWAGIVGLDYIYPPMWL